MAKVYVVGTCDTKAAELRFACTRVRAAGAVAVLVDVGTSGAVLAADVTAAEVAVHHPEGAVAVFAAGDRGRAVTAMAVALERFLTAQDDIGAVLGLGGSGNTALVTAAMRGLPVGVPKIMVSTVASGQVAPYVGESDITLMYSVVDIAGLNRISRAVIGNAAHAAAGMALHRVPALTDARPSIGLTMFGVTTAAVTQIRAALEPSHDCLVFHATGTGGRSMEKLVDSGLLDTVIDLTTTEVADFLVGGVFPCTEDRFGATIRTGTPWVGSVGAVDMVNFGPRATVPPEFAGRLFHIHNAQVTLMRTTPDENTAIGDWIAGRLNLAPGPVRLLLPLRGISALDAPGQPFHDPVADQALFAAIRATFRTTDGHRLIEVDAHVNDPAFAAAVVDQFRQITA